MRLIDADQLHKVISEWSESVIYKDWVQSAIANAPTIAPPPNDPLTLDQLREMDGDAVWVTPLDGRPPMWCFVVVPANAGMGYVRNQTRTNGLVCNGIMGHFRTWLAYRRRPEEG